MMDILLTALAVLVFYMLHQWLYARADAKAYRNGLFHVIAILDAPVEQWEKRFRRDMTDAEWFGFQRGYQQAFVDALNVLDYKMQIRVHGQRLQPTPGEEESLSDFSQRS